MENQLIEKLEISMKSIQDCITESGVTVPDDERWKIGDILGEAFHLISDLQKTIRKNELTDCPVEYRYGHSLDSIFWQSRDITEVTAEDTRTNDKASVIQQMIGHECLMAVGFCLGRLKSETALKDFMEGFIKVTLRKCRQEKNNEQR